MDRVKWRSMAIAIMAVAFLSQPVASDTGDDFSENLISDLGPILQLFGEQVAMQFLSQSMGWADHIIFAMAPLGVLTAVVGAIRVAGPTWLKTIIGRARENKAEAELELMSSTSLEVGEMWNGQALIRTIGIPTIQEIIYFPRRRNETDFGLQTLEQAVSMGYLSSNRPNLRHKNKSSRSFLGRLLRLTTVHRRSNVEISGDLENSDTVGSQNPVSAPNIFINIQPPRNRTDLYVTAMVGIVTQLAVLAFSGLTTYYPPWKLQKDGREIEAHAYPLTTVGTLAMVTGMLICALVIERSSKEVDWRANDEEFKAARVLWLQQHGLVGDQLFESFALFARGKRNSILTSRRRQSSVSTTDSRNTHSDHGGAESRGLRSMTVIGTLITLVGFVIQFTGLREMNWTTSIMQLAATLFMTCLRSWVRRDLAVPPIAIKIPADHEIDWLATRLARYQQEHWPDDEGHFERFQREEWEWSIMNSTEATGEFNATANCDYSDDKMLAQRIMKVREHLGQLCRWANAASGLAVSVANSIEDTMNILFPDEVSNTFVWSLRVRISANPRDEQDIYFTVRRVEKFWAANATELEAALSLWLLTAHEEEERQKAMKRPKDNEDWLRRGETAVRKECMRLLCGSTTQSNRDLSWWIPDSNQLKCVNKFSGSQTSKLHDPTSIVELDSYRIVENSRCGVEPKAASGVSRYLSQTLEFENRESCQRHSDDGFIAVISDDSLAVVFARSLFSSFVSAIADKIVYTGSETTLAEADPTDADFDSWKSLKLENSALLQVAQSVERAALGTLQEAYTCIIPPLHLKNALPCSLGVLDLAKRHARPEETLGNWQVAGSIYRWLFRISSTFGSQDVIFIEAIAECMEFLRQLNITANTWSQNHKKDAFRGLEKLRLSLLNDLKRADKRTTSHLAWMYDQRLSLHGLEHVRPVGIEMHLNVSFLKEKLGHSPLHQAILSPEACKVVQANSLIEGGKCDLKDILGWTPLHLAATRGEDLVASSLLQAGADPNSKNIAGWTPLHCFSFRKHENKKLAWRLLQSGADVGSRGRDGVSPLHCAAMSDDGVMTKILIDSGANVEIQDNSRKTPLHWAARNGSCDALPVLVEKGASLESEEYNKMTPLHIAAENDKTEMIEQLVKLGANVRARDKFGFSALHLAARGGVAAVLETILRLGANINEKSLYGQTALHISAQEGYESLTEELLNMKANVNSTDRSGKTPLHLAAEEGHESLVAILARSGADINMRDIWDKSAYNYAIEKKHDAVTRRLRALGAEVGSSESNEEF